MDWIEANGVVLRYDLSGSGKDTLILIHEVGGGIESFDEVLPAFQQEFRVLRYDQRGFGLSEKTKVITIDSIMADLVGLLDALKISGPCHVAGTAMGAGLAIAFAARHPARTKRLAISSPATKTNAQHKLDRAARVKAILEGGMRSSVDTSLLRSYPELLRGDKARYQRFRNRWMMNDPEGFIALNNMTTTMDLTADFAKITCPTLVIGCTHDPIRPPAMSKEIAGQIRGAKYIEVASGHFMAVETPELFVQHVLPFLKGA
ncbi:MAG: alpha/beta fold hydrolase [Candidatus Lambdaproteobacteria bacterium]|nr:alpha/beta fold hydrolase [Candidatus Lambdaproteobacteria bacterium]